MTTRKLIVWAIFYTILGFILFHGAVYLHSQNFFWDVPLQYIMGAIVLFLAIFVTWLRRE